MTAAPPLPPQQQAAVSALEHLLARGAIPRTWEAGQQLVLDLDASPLRVIAMPSADLAAAITVRGVVAVAAVVRAAARARWPIVVLAREGVGVLDLARLQEALACPAHGDHAVRIAGGSDRHRQLALGREIAETVLAAAAAAKRPPEET